MSITIYENQVLVGTHVISYARTSPSYDIFYLLGPFISQHLFVRFFYRNCTKTTQIETKVLQPHDYVRKKLTIAPSPSPVDWLITHLL